MISTKLQKYYDQPDILEYRYKHGNTTPYILKSIIFLVSSSLIYFIIHHHKTLSLYSINIDQRWTFILTIAATILLNCLVTIHRVEYVTVIPNVGIQLKETSGFFLTTQNRLDFIPSSQVIDVIINEGFRGLFVAHYLAVMVRDRDSLSVVLPGAKLKIGDFVVLRSAIRKKLGTSC